MKDRMAAIGDTAMDNIANAIRLKGNLRASEFVVAALQRIIKGRCAAVVIGII